MDGVFVSVSVVSCVLHVCLVSVYRLSARDCKFHVSLGADLAAWGDALVVLLPRLLTQSHHSHLDTAQAVRSLTREIGALPLPSSLLARLLPAILPVRHGRHVRHVCVLRVGSAFGGSPSW